MKLVIRSLLHARVHFIGFSAMCATSVIACGSDATLDASQLEDDQELTCYRGGLVVAERINGALIVDGDLEITDAEAECGLGNFELQGRRAPSSPGSVWDSSIYGVAWPEGTVPYEIDTAFTNTEEGAIEDAMDDWADAAPGVSFRPKTGSDTNYVRFVKDSVCQSGYGMIAGVRTIKLTNSCTQSFSVHHEIGHALGLQHEHTRADRDDYVVVSSSDQNYSIDSGADLFDYDFDSVMHYSFGGSISLKSGVTVPAGVTVGQRDHLSSNDIASVRAMYPVAYTHSVLFANTGTRQICRLSGREEDVATDYVRTSATTALAGSGESVSTSGIAVGDHTVTCTIRSVFWSEDYDYPNASFTVDFSSVPSGDVQTYEDTATVRVLTPGLIPVLFG